MDSEFLDRLARTVASIQSRRVVLRGLAGAALLDAAWPQGGAAHAESVPLGGACIRSHQCIQYFVAQGPGVDLSRQAVACDFNGFAYDGEFNCCRYRGGLCSVDTECCGYLRCVNGRFCDS